ncbi:uncharacterized protein TRUGW13939_02374 [Talaromyces rugulosus]|uniref:RBR-type E3 ubiquitin transferase n=1 Tax=Talaromyces rugulosus TaxID=121627 RepID=A0A7H8QN62_TALRU|nr:uncharacterized protein TRUGW13939_02374 [Talaromyces rugulosus]QKX55282.1 hypothetical protein TRUGW13939_02374 [Talaromyces rugulosus]
MDDLDDLDTSKTHNTQPDQTSDAETSLHLYARELKRLKSTIGDKILAQSMANHALLENADGEAEINSTCCGRKRPRPFALQCEVCSEEKESTEVFRLNCDHLYCNECLQKLFEGLMTDESLFPPRCCRKTIDIENAGTFLTPDIIKRFNNRKIEIETPNRIYCSSNLCSSFIHPDNITADVATCQKCGIVTCAICKTESHAGDCPNDPAIQSLRHLSSEKGWQSCYNCNRIIELTTGCNHITYDPLALADKSNILTLKKVAIAVLSFATSAAINGRHVRAHCGRKKISFSVLRKS